MNYDNLRYMDRYLKTDNLKYYIATDEDTEEIKKVIDFSAGLVIKDYEISNLSETLESNRNANRYVNAYLGVLDISELERQIILDNYEEKNQYYIDLKNKHQIDYIDARLAKDLTILKYENNSLNPNDRRLFEECYYEAVRYFYNVLRTDAFRGEKLNRCYFKEVLIFFTIQKYITKKMERFFDIDRYTNRDCKNAFISIGLDYFDGLPLSYQRKLLKSINNLIQYKGTDRCLYRILDVFGYKNIRIFKYVLAKDWEKDRLYFYKTPLGEAVNTQNDPIVPYDAIVKGDALWQSEFEEEIEKEFNTIDTKYISVDLATDVFESTMDMAYLMSLLNILEKNYQDSKATGGFTFYNKKISDSPIEIYHAVIAVISLVLERKKLGDVINHNHKPKETESIYGFDRIVDNDDVRDLLRDIKITLIQNKYELSKSKQYRKLYEFFSTFALDNFNSKDLYTHGDIINDFKSNPVNLEELEKFGHYFKSNSIIDRAKKEYIDTFLMDVLHYISEKIIRGDYDIISVKTLFPNLFKILNKYTLYKYRDNSDPTENLQRVLSNIPIAETQFYELVKTINNLELNDAIKNNNLDEALSLLKIIIERDRSEALDKYGIDGIQDILSKNPADILHYTELSIYFELYTQFNITREKYYNMEDFSNVLQYNVELRKDLETFIKEINNGELYRKYLLLWDTKFTVAKDTDLILSFSTFKEYLNSVNTDLLNYITVPEVIKDNNKLVREWYNQTMYELCESLDIFINDPELNHFVNNSFIGIVEHIKRYVMIAILVFKAYTIDLNGSNSVIRYDDPTFNSIRLFDNIENFTITDTITDSFYLEDVTTIYSKETFNDNINIKEDITIKQVNYDSRMIQLPNGEMGDVPIKDKNGEYVILNTLVTQKLNSSVL